jgi:hypothetical protein
VGEVPEQGANSGRLVRTRRNLIGAALTALGSALIVVILWLISRGAPSAGRDPAWPPAG